MHTERVNNHIVIQEEINRESSKINSNQVDACVLQPPANVEHTNEPKWP